MIIITKVVISLIKAKNGLRSDNGLDDLNL